MSWQQTQRNMIRELNEKIFSYRKGTPAPF